MSSKFVYVTYIRTTPAKLWDALTKAEFTKQYWSGTYQDCAWTVGSSWKLMIPDGRVGDAGEVLEIAPPTRLVLKWRNEFMAELKAEGFTRCTLEIVQQTDMVQLTVTHESERDESKMIEGVSGGWPQILSSLKSLLETGESLAVTAKWPEGL